LILRWRRSSAPEPPLRADDPDPEQAWKALTLVNDWIKHAEAKTGAVLAATGASAILLFNLLRASTATNVLVYILAAVAVASTVVGGVCALTALYPRLRLRRRRTVRASNDPVNPLFFHDIVRSYGTDGPSYAAVLHTLTTSKVDLVKHLSFQIHANAIVAARKYKWSNRAIIALSLNLFTIGALAVATSWRF
jgi:hypothetical protein